METRHCIGQDLEKTSVIALLENNYFNPRKGVPLALRVRKEVAGERRSARLLLRDGVEEVGDGRERDLNGT